jgi:hypothetical protein
LESFRRADLKAQKSFVNHEMDAATQDTLFGSVYDGVASGALTVHTAVAGGVEQVGAFFRSLVGGNGSKTAASIAPEVVTPEGATPEVAVSMKPREVEHSVSNASAKSAQTELGDATGGASTPDPGLGRRSGTYRVDYQVGGVLVAGRWCVCVGGGLCHHCLITLIPIFVAEVPHRWLREASLRAAAFCAATLP